MTRGYRIDVSSFGLVTGEVVPRQFTSFFVDSEGQNNDTAGVTSISDLGFQASLSMLELGSITILGCGGI